MTRRQFLQALGMTVVGAVVLAETPAARWFAPETPIDVALSDEDIKRCFDVAYRIWPMPPWREPQPTERQAAAIAAYEAAIAPMVTAFKAVGFFPADWDA